ncbi:ATP-binding protein [Nocardiopsis sp. NPDC058631]|uniref:ATP-binding protein n=1 Tax=Nocardiopsis sp. NPDC058631 TaxID=3346566 RepID=UPI0036626008
MTDTPSPRRAVAAWAAAPRWLYLPLLALPAWIWALLEVPDAATAPAVTAAAAVMVLLVTLALLLDLRERELRRLRARLDRVRHDTAALSREHLPELARMLRAGDSAGTALQRLDMPEATAVQDVLHAVATEVASSERRRSAAMVACATAAGRVQALTTTMLADLRRMQDRYGDGAADGEILGDLMNLDHTTAQAGRVADSIAILTGARSGRRWGRAIPLESVVRGAMGRIGAYRRVRVHNVPDQAVAGFAAEGVIHALAELLDNAAKFSPPTAEVHVHVEQVQAGLALMVEDGGLVMGEDALSRAHQAVDSGLELAAMSGTRLGLSVVGQLARRYGLTVSFRSSSRGGTAVVLLLPQKLVKPMPEPVVPAVRARHARTPAAAVPATAPGPDPVPRKASRSTDGLPQRRRGQTLAATQSTREATPRTGERTAPSKGFGDFRSAVRGQAAGEEPAKDT